MLIGLLLFSQAAAAIRPCLDAGMSAAAAVAASQEHDCCETQVLEANLCLLECTDALSASASSSLPPVLEHVVTIHFPMAEGSPRRLSEVFDPPVRGPPKCIRFCSYLI